MQPKWLFATSFRAGYFRIASAEAGFRAVHPKFFIKLLFNEST
jgi:hypothetical protein